MSATSAPRAALLTTGLAGIAMLVLQLTGQQLSQAGAAEPAFDAGAAEISAFFAANDPDLMAAGNYLSALSILAALVFVGGLAALLRHDWRAPLVLVCGAGYALAVGVGWELAATRVDEGVDPQVARLAFDLGNLSFATAWVALGGFLLVTGGALRTHRLAPGWTAWLAALAGVCTIAARAVWTTPFWVFGYALFATWTVVVCSAVLRRARHRAPEQTGAVADAVTTR